MFQFRANSTLSEDDLFYNKSPTNNDKVHVLVCVVPADKVGRMSDEVLKKIRDVRKEASDLGEGRNQFISFCVDFS